MDTVLTLWTKYARILELVMKQKKIIQRNLHKVSKQQENKDEETFQGFQCCIKQEHCAALSIPDYVMVTNCLFSKPSGAIFKLLLTASINSVDWNNPAINLLQCKLMRDLSNVSLDDILSELMEISQQIQEKRDENEEESEETPQSTEETNNNDGNNTNITVKTAIPTYMEKCYERQTLDLIQTTIKCLEEEQIKQQFKQRQKSFETNNHNQKTHNNDFKMSQEATNNLNWRDFMEIERVQAPVRINAIKPTDPRIDKSIRKLKKGCKLSLVDLYQLINPDDVIKYLQETSIHAFEHSTDITLKTQLNLLWNNNLPNIHISGCSNSTRRSIRLNRKCLNLLLKVKNNIKNIKTTKIIKWEKISKEYKKLLELDSRTMNLLSKSTDDGCSDFLNNNKNAQDSHKDTNKRYA